MSKKRCFAAILEEIEEAVLEPGRLKERAAEVCKELSSNFAGLALDTDGVQLLLHEALEAKFAEAGLDVVVAVFAGTPLRGFSEEELLAQATLGRCPESAYNMEVGLVDNVVTVRYFRVSEEGNSEE